MHIVLWLWAIPSFILLRILIYSFGFFPEAYRIESQISSGSRILLHIMPAATFYAILVLAHALAGLTKAED